jgi:hypothetical protein
VLRKQKQRSSLSSLVSFRTCHCTFPSKQGIAPSCLLALTYSVIQVSAGYCFSVAVTAEGNVYAWGFNERGQLGQGHRFNKDTPQMVKVSGVVDSACGQQHVVVRDSSGNLFSWGFGGFGQLGQGRLGDSLLPGKVIALEAVEEIACGNHFSVARTANGIYGWGHSEYGQMGGGQNHIDWETGEKGKGYSNSTPVLLSSIGNVKVKQLSCGHLHNVAISNSNQCYTWGWGAGGCLGHGDHRYQLVPKLVLGIHGALASSAAGWQHTLLVREATSSAFAYSYQHLLDSGAYSDFKLRVQEQTFRVHRFFLKTRCPKLWEEIKRGAEVGKAIAKCGQLAVRIGRGGFNEEVKEMRDELASIAAALREHLLSQPLEEDPSKDEHQCVEPIRPLAMAAVLRYIYTDHLTCTPHLVPQVREAAMIYDLRRLVVLCDNFQGAVEPPPSQFAEEMQNAAREESNSDLVLSLDGVRISAHKAVLTARSKYFKNLLEGKFAEAHGAEVKIEGISEEVMRLFLDYLYGGNKQLINNDTAVDLLEAADRFLHEELHQVCERFLVESLDKENALPLLYVADKLHAHRLKRHCVLSLSQLESLEGVQDLEQFVKVSPTSLVQELERVWSATPLGVSGELSRLREITAQV